MTTTTTMIPFSPLSCLPIGELTPSGLIQFDSNDGEVEVSVRQNVELRWNNEEPPPTRPASASALGEWKDRNIGLVCTLSTHRILFLYEGGDSGSSASSGKQQQQRQVHFLHLSSLASNPVCTGGGFVIQRSSKILLSTYSHGELILVFRGSSKTTASGRSDRDDFYPKLCQSYERKAWEDSARAEERKQNNAAERLAKRKVGVDAILTKTKIKHVENQKIAHNAFADGEVETLMKEAGELVGIIRKYASTLERNNNAKSTGEDGTTEEEEEDAARLSGMLEDMGMASALSGSERGAGGRSKSTYHQDLARQISDFLQWKNRLKQQYGGMMTLTDLYCLFNRARGTNMVSPEDLLASLGYMEELGLGMNKRQFPSGVLVIQDMEFSDEEMAAKLKNLADNKNNNKKKKAHREYGSITVLDVSKAFKISAMIANEHLQSAERLGVLCRDVTLDGIRFFPNHFCDKGTFVVVK